MSQIPTHLKYTKDHEWISGAGPIVRVGITDFAQSALGDIVYIQMPKLGEVVKANAVCGEVESTKSVSEIYAPLSGTVVNVNDALNANPEIINSDPYEAGWICEIELSSAHEVDQLMSADDYAKITA